MRSPVRRSDETHASITTSFRRWSSATRRSGSSGYSEAEARERFSDVKAYATRFTSLYHGITERKTPTFIKLVVAGPDERVVGLHVFGLGADELLQGFAVAIRMGATKRDFDSTVAIHPTAAEEVVTLR